MTWSDTRDSLNQRLAQAPWWIWIVIIAVLAVIVIVPYRCLKYTAPAATKTQEQRVSSGQHITDTFRAMVSKLSANQARPDLQAAIKSLIAEHGEDFFRDPNTGEPYRINPNLRLWMSNFPGGPPAPPPSAGADSAIILVPASKKMQQKQNVAMIGVKPRGMPATVQKGQEPAWLAQAIVPVQPGSKTSP